MARVFVLLCAHDALLQRAHAHACGGTVSRGSKHLTLSKRVSDSAVNSDESLIAPDT
jgi:hypothetical protein